MKKKTSGSSRERERMKMKIQTSGHAQLIVAEILRKHPCPQCGAVEILTDAVVPGATCDCGRKEGAQERWETADIWSRMSKKDQRLCTTAEKYLENFTIDSNGYTIPIGKLL